MHKLIAPLTAAALAAAALVASPSLASAETEYDAYICTVRHQPQPVYAPLGDHGALIVEWYTEPNCAGQWKGWGYVFSEGQYHSWAEPKWVYTELGLMTLARELQAAAIAGERIRVYLGGSMNLAIKTIKFNGN